MRRIAFTIVVAISISTGCKKGGEEKGTETKISKKETKVVVPGEVKKQWKSVIILLINKENNKKTEYEIEIGKSMELGDSGLNVEVVYFLPDFKMEQDKITSASNELKNPAVHIIVNENGKNPVKLWLFYNYPDVHAFIHPKYQLTLIGFQKKE